MSTSARVLPRPEIAAAAASAPLARHLVAFVPNALGFAPGQRTRIETWEPYLAEAGWRVTYCCFEDEALHRVLYQPGHTARKAAGMVRCYARQLGRALQDLDPTVVLVYREAAMIGPPLLERLLRRRRVPLVFDLDDPTFVPYSSPINGVASRLKHAGKAAALARMSDRVLAINESIGGFLRQHNPRVEIVPIYADSDRYVPRPRAADHPVRIGWIGSHTTVRNLGAVAPVLGRLQAETGCVLRVIGPAGWEVSGLAAEYRTWSAAEEVELLSACDVGIVPLIPHPWNPWKFYYKIVQYQALGLPVVAEDVPSNHELIRDGVNGFLVTGAAQWHDRLRRLVEDRELRRRMGAAAREFIVRHYALRPGMERLCRLFDGIAAGPDRRVHRP